ncbi:MAG TPA: response regulator [Thermoanaerobaculia bacterium]|jgi:CheY-like chemotaxis protein|nr:response regulator [Thermoanaerobaculia bacterium]
MIDACPVLIAEDDPAIRALLASAFRRRRIRMAMAANGEEALQHLQNQEWLVLVLDLMMPTVTGWEVISWLAANRERKPKTVIVVSATDRALLQELDATVVNAVIFKPFDVLQLTAYVKASCELDHSDRRRSRVIASEH